MKTNTEIKNVSKFDAFKSVMLKFFTVVSAYSGRELRRIVVYSIIALFTFILHTILSTFTQFHFNGIVTIDIGFTALLLLLVEFNYYTYPKESFTIIGILSIIVSFLLTLIFLNMPNYKKIEYYTPTNIYKNEQGIIVTYGNIVLHNNSVDMYNSDNVKVCKILNWNSWNIRLSDGYTICKGK